MLNVCVCVCVYVCVCGLGGGCVITDSIVSEVKRNRFFSILCNETSDCSNKEQLSLVLRFVDYNYNIREDLYALFIAKKVSRR